MFHVGTWGGSWRYMAPLNSIAKQVPWWGKIAAKVFLAHLPVDYETWKRLHLFQHGAMEEPAYAYGVFKKHFERSSINKHHASTAAPSGAVLTRNAINRKAHGRESNGTISRRIEVDGFVGLELGPGDSLLSAMVAHAFGASAYYLIDVGAFAQTDANRYRAMAQYLADQGLPTLDIVDLTSVKTVLAACRATYGTSGLASLRAIPDSSIDFIWSHSVLEHLKKAEFEETMHQLRRVLSDGGACSHSVDLRDHLGGGLNNLRFSERVWESQFMAESGFYTNRVRYSEMLALFRKAGFVADVIAARSWDELPTPKSRLWSRFGCLPEEELCVSGFEVVLKPI